MTAIVNPLLEPALEEKALIALPAAMEVPLHSHPPKPDHLPVDVAMRQGQGLLAAVLHADVPTVPRRSLISHNAFSSAFLPRWSRDITVPMGTSMMRAISL